MSSDLGVVAKRYALALFNIAKEQNTIDKVEEELLSIRETLKSSNELQAVLEHPKVTVAQKKQLLNDIFASSVSKEVLNILLLLIDRKREEIILELISQYISLANDERGIVEAVAYTVQPLSKDELKVLSETFAKRLGKKTLRITNVVDKELIGGVKLVAGNQVFDGSVQGQLNRIQRNLTSA